MTTNAINVFQDVCIKSDTELNTILTKMISTSTTITEEATKIIKQPIRTRSYVGVTYV